MKSINQNQEVEEFEKEDFKKCECGFINAENAKFCASCGIEIKKLDICEKGQTTRFCNQCGNEVLNRDCFCNKCGNKIVSEKILVERDIEENAFELNNLVNNLDKIKIKLGIRILSVISFLCFFMNFVKESAMGFGIQLNGFEMAFGKESEGFKMNIFVFFSIICCIITLCNVFQKGRVMKTVSLMSILSSICIFIYIITYEMYYGYDEWSSFVAVEHGFVVWAIIIINVTIGFLSGLMDKNEGKNTQ